MRHRILSTPINSSLSLVAVRDRSRQIGELFGLDNLQRTRFVTAISELGRNAILYAGGGMLTFMVGDATEQPDTQCVIAQIADHGPGIAKLQQVLSESTSQAASATQAAQSGVGIAGSRRLVDGFFMTSNVGPGPGGTTVIVEMFLPRGTPRLEVKALDRLVEQLTRRKAQTPMEELEQQNREMLLALEQLRRNKADLEDADTRKNEFLAMLAHELRNPLAAISLSLEVARRVDNPTSTFAVIGRQTAQLSRMVNDLLDVSRLTQGKVDLQTELVYLDTVLDGAIEMTTAEVARRGHTVRIIPGDTNPTVRVDIARLQQVFSNILHNAARYTTHADTITVEVQDRGHEVVVAISDNGIGIDGNMLPRVFDLFAQGSKGLDRADSGLGIGLTVVQRLIHDHGGEVAVFSKGVGHGSRFEVTLPTVNGPVPEKTARAAITPMPSLAKHKVLIVDDNGDSAAALGIILDVEGYPSIEANDGATALAQAVGFGARVGIIDIGLPDMSGFDVARGLREQFRERPLTLIALSGYSSEDFRQQASAAGFDHYFAKPLKMDDLLALLATLPVASMS